MSQLFIYPSSVGKQIQNESQNVFGHQSNNTFSTKLILDKLLLLIIIIVIFIIIIIILIIIIIIINIIIIIINYYN